MLLQEQAGHATQRINSAVQYNTAELAGHMGKSKFYPTAARIQYSQAVCSAGAQPLKDTASHAFLRAGHLCTDLCYRLSVNDTT